MKRIKLNHDYEALVDDTDFNSLNQYKWNIAKRKNIIYAQRAGKDKNGRKAPILMHIQLMNSNLQMRTDHIDGNGLNNQRYNLRLCSASENGLNRRDDFTKNNNFDPKRKMFRARIMINRKDIHIGYFNTFIDAMEAKKNYLLNLKK